MDNFWKFILLHEITIIMTEKSSEILKLTDRVRLFTISLLLSLRVAEYFNLLFLKFISS